MNKFILFLLGSFLLLGAHLFEVGVSQAVYDVGGIILIGLCLL